MIENPIELFKHLSDEKLFLLSCMHNSVVGIKEYIRRGGDINMLLNPDWDVPDCGRTGYEYALYEGSQEVCEFLINHLDFNINTLTETGVHILEIDAELRDCTLDTDIMNHDDFSWESTSNKTIPLIALLEDLCPEELEEVLEENPHVNGRYRIKGRERGWY